jgi:hypothetical protein
VEFRGGADEGGGPLRELRGLTPDTDVRALRAAAASACGLAPEDAATLPPLLSSGAGAPRSLRDGVTLRTAGVAPHSLLLAVAREPWRSRQRARGPAAPRALRRLARRAHAATRLAAAAGTARAPLRRVNERREVKDG